jgi:hypothetical protein
VIDLEAHWWGMWVVPALTLGAAMTIAIAGRLLVVRIATPRGRKWEVGAGRLPESNRVAQTFQRSFLILTTLMVLYFTARAELLSCLLYAGYFGAATWLFIMSLRDGASRGLGLLHNVFLLAFALGLALSILIGLAVYVAMDFAVNEYIQAH